MKWFRRKMEKKLREELKNRLEFLEAYVNAPAQEHIRKYYARPLNFPSNYQKIHSDAFDEFIAAEN
ncbi:MAG: hypothetical protein AAF611_09835 [Bacteroidota bacterium]